MKQGLLKTSLGLGLLLGGFVLGFSAQAQDQVELSNRELNAVFTLMRPELNYIELHDTSGVFSPSPSLKFLKVEETHFDFDLGSIGSIADLRFHHLNASVSRIYFENNLLNLEVKVKDQSRVLRSRLGSVSVSGVKLFARLDWKKDETGMQRLVLVSRGFEGSLSGSGVLRSGFLLARLRDVLLSTLSAQMVRLLEKPKAQEVIQKGLIQWSGFYTGSEHQELIPGSIEFFQRAELNGMHYLAR